MVIKHNNAYRKKSNVIDALNSSVEASLHCHHQLTFSVGEICTHYGSQYPCDEHITVNTQQSLATIMQHLGKSYILPFLTLFF